MKNKLKRLFGFLSSSTGVSENFTKVIENITGITPDNPDLYITALRHKSSVNSHQESNERLEFLGDAVLTSVISEYLYFNFPEEPEGFLSELRSKIVNRKHLNKIGLQLNLHKHMECDEALLEKDLLLNTSILGNALEALIGAVYTDKDYHAARNFVLVLVKKQMDIYKLTSKEFNYKSRLIEWAQKEKREVEFALVSSYLNGSVSKFTVEVLIEGKVSGKGTGSNKKEAEKEASRLALEKIGVL